MCDVVVIGGGFAGVWSAAAAQCIADQASAELSVTLIAPGHDLVIRPRLYEADPQQMTVPLDGVLEPIGVGHLKATVTHINIQTQTVTAVDHAEQEHMLSYRRLVLAAGSQLRRPELPGGGYVHDVDTIDGAMALDAHLHRLPDVPGRHTAVVVGAGFTGLEVATELIGRLRTLAATSNGSQEPPRVVLIERADVVGPDLGPGPRPAIIAALDQLDIEVRLGQSVTRISPTKVHLNDGAAIAAATMVWTAGIQASPLTAQVPGRRDTLGRLAVNEELRVAPVPAVFAAGDTATAMLESGRPVMPSCQHAIPLGKYAGHNAAADLVGLPTASFGSSPYVTCLDLGAAGALFTTGFERTIALSGAEGKARKQTINQQWIYPPVDDPAEILRVARHRPAGHRRRVHPHRSPRRTGNQRYRIRANAG